MIVDERSELRHDDYLREPRVRRRHDRCRIPGWHGGCGGLTATPGGDHRGLAFTTAVRVVDRVHDHTAGLGLDTLPTVAAGLADLDELIWALPTSPTVARQSIGTRRISVLGRRRTNRLLGDQLDAGASEQPILAPAPALSSTLWWWYRPGCSAAGVRCPDGSRRPDPTSACRRPQVRGECSASRRRGSAGGRCCRCGSGRTRWSRPWPARRPCSA